MELQMAIILFSVSAALVIAAGIGLAISGNIIAIRTGWGRLWVGALLVGGGTSLPELVTSITAVRINSPALSAGDVFGSNMLNMNTLAILAAILGGRLFFQKVLPLQLTVASFAIVLTGTALIFGLIQTEFKWMGISPATVVILGIFLVGSYILFRKSKSTAVANEETPAHSLRWGYTCFAMASALILVSAPLLTISAQNIATITGVSESFIGILALAIVTSLPEMTAVAAAIRIGATDLAVAQIYGTNAFNIAILAIADIFYTSGSIFASLDASHLIAGTFAILLMCLGGIQIRLRKPLKHFSLVEPSSSLTVILYFTGVVIVFAAI